jgi:GNAT superfamily N-acetyltransferase
MSAGRQAVAGHSADEIRIRDLRPEDLAQVIEIDAGHTGVAKPTYWESVFDSFVVTAQRPAAVGLGAEIDGQLVGYLLGEVRAFEFGSEPCGWVFAVGVDPDHLRKNIASDLLQKACLRFHRFGVDKVRTMVERTDIPVMSFFRSSGFVGGAFYQLEMDLEEEA